MEAIGGYFSLELPLREEYYKNAIRLNTGRNCLEYILRARGYKKVYLPYYTCEAVMEPINKLGIPYEFYHINMHLELSYDIHLNYDEALLYTNYYGLKQRYTEELAQKYGSSLIVDNTQAFFARPLSGIDTFYTCRKFFGVPDGAYLYCDAVNANGLELSTSYDRFEHLLKRIDLSAGEGFGAYHENEDKLEHQPICIMSRLTQRLMQSIDYDDVAKRRRANYKLLHKALGEENNLKLTLDEDAIPMVYPFFSSDEGLREKLIENKIFVARYWPNVLEWTTKEDLEYLLACQMQPLPIDQRYGMDDMKKIIEIKNK